MSTKRGERILGPYHQRSGWLVVSIDAKGKRESSVFETEGRAQRYADMMRADLEKADHTTETAFALYKAHLEKKGTKPQSITTTERAFDQFFPSPVSLRLLTEKRCQALYDDLTTRLCEQTGKPYAADTHRNALSQAKSFLAWCAASKRGWLKENPLEDVEGTGKRRPRGKSKGKAGNVLHIKQSRAWYQMALFKAQQGDQGAVAGLMALLLGMRPSEIVSRLVSDLDEDAAPCDLLWIEDSKTEDGRRQLEVPDVLTPLLVALTKDKAPDQYLFTAKRSHGKAMNRNWIKNQVQRICDLAEVPRVTAYFMRGQLATLTHERGMAGHMIATMMGHADEQTSIAAYAKPGSAAAGARMRGWQVLDGGSAAK
jgi:integrase